MNKVSRSSLYDSDEPTSDTEDYILPQFEFEEVTVDATPEPEQPHHEEEEEDAFSFKLFSTETKVSINDFPEDDIRQERPHSYYFVEYTEDDRRRFSAVAVSGDDIVRVSGESPSPLLVEYQRQRVLDLTKHNAMIDAAKRRKRPGKNKRAGMKVAQEKKAAREAEAKARAKRQATRKRPAKLAKSAAPPKKRFATE